MNQNIAFIGMSHLGLNYLAASVKNKNFVTGFDSNKKLIENLKKNEILIDEPNLKEILKKNKDIIKFTSDFKNLRKFNLIFISLDVETDKNNIAQLKKLKILISKTLKYLKKGSTLVVLSQSQPGFMRKINFKKKNLFYQVETLIFGQAVNRALHPERIIVGCDKKETKITKAYLQYLKSFKCPIVKMNYESAELTKIAINAYLATSLTTTNILADISNRINADWNEIIPALRLDKRIGKFAYLKPGLGISGGNIERDINVLGKLSKKNLLSKKYFKSILENSNLMKSWVYRILIEKKILKKKLKQSIGILGLSYKANTNSLKNSPTLLLLKKIKKQKVRIHDPKAKLKKNTTNCKQVEKINLIIKKSDILIIMTAWKNYEDLEKSINKLRKNIVIIDPHRVINFSLIKNRHVKYFKFG